jgi:hypothetical protein
MSEYATLKRRCAAEKWVMPENDPSIGTLSAAARTHKNDFAFISSGERLIAKFYEKLKLFNQ